MPPQPDWKRQRRAARRRLAAAAVALLLLVVAVGGWALVAERGAAPGDADAVAAGSTIGGAAPPSAASGAAGTDTGEVAREPGLGTAAPAQRPLTVAGDGALSALATRYGHGGDGSAERPFVLMGSALLATGADSIRITDTRLHLRIETLAMNGAGDGVALVLSNVTHVSVIGARLAGHHTGIQLVDAHDIVVSGAVLSGNRAGIHLTGTRDVLIEASRFLGNTHAVIVAPQSADRAASARITVQQSSVDGTPATLAGTGGSGIVLAGRDHVIAGNTITGHAPGAVRVTGMGTLVANNAFQGGAGNAVILQGTRDVLLDGNTFTGHAKTAVVAFDGRGLTVTGNRFQDEAAGGIALVRETRAVVAANEMTNVPYAVSVWDGDAVRVTENTVKLAEHALRVYGGKALEARGNDAQQITDTAFLLLGTSDPVLRDNRASGPSRVGIYLGGTSGALLAGNLVAGAEQAVIASAGARETSIVENRFFTGTVGVRLGESIGVRLAGNQVMFQGQGIFVDAQVRGLVVESGLVYASTVGVNIESGAPAVHLAGLQVINSPIAAIMIVGSRGHVLESLELVGNSVGVLLVDAHDITMKASQVNMNRLGMQYVNSTQNLVYNNHFENNEIPGDQNVLLTNSPGNWWNVSRRAGENVVGGPVIAGNYWHDYDGADADGDGIGDVPHQPIPYHPLLEEPAYDLGLPMGPFDLHPLVKGGGGLPVSGPAGDRALAPVTDLLRN